MNRAGNVVKLMTYCRAGQRHDQATIREGF